MTVIEWEPNSAFDVPAIVYAIVEVVLDGYNLSFIADKSSVHEIVHIQRGHVEIGLPFNHHKAIESVISIQHHAVVDQVSIGVVEMADAVDVRDFVGGMLDVFGSRTARIGNVDVVRVVVAFGGGLPTIEFYRIY